MGMAYGVAVMRSADALGVNGEDGKSDGRGTTGIGDGRGRCSDLAIRRV
jgi:hypothetical protein